MRDDPRFDRPTPDLTRRGADSADSADAAGRGPGGRRAAVGAWPWALAAAALAVALSSCRSVPARHEPPAAAGAHAWFFLESSAAGGLPVVLPESGVRFAVEARPVLSEEDVTAVTLSTEGLGPALVFTLTPDASRRLAAALAARPDSRLVLAVNAVPVGARRIHAVPADGRISLLIEEPDAAIPRLVRDLQSTAAGWRRASRP